MSDESDARAIALARPHMVEAGRRFCATDL
jgi:hypothetical protein